MQIRQIQIANDHIQDRLVLRVASQANEEFRIFLTRRLLREFWPHLSGLLDTASAAQPVDGDAVPGESTSFEQPFNDENASYPLGSTPLLASEISFDTMSDGSVNLTFREGRERSLRLGLNADLLQALCAMLRAGSVQANWDLALEYTAKPDALGEAPRSTRLH